MPRPCSTRATSAKVAASGGNLASPLLAEAVGGGAGSTGGAVLLALIAAVAFATILAVVAGLTLTSSASVAHDLYNNVIKKGQATEKEEIRVARIAAFAIGLVAILLAIPAQKLNIAFLVALAFAVAASANLPAIVYNMFWRRFNTRGAVWSIYGGLISSRRPGVLLAGHVRQGRRPGHRQEPVAAPDQHRLLVVPAGEPGHRVDPARLPPRLPRHGHARRSRTPRSATPSSRSARSPAPAPRRPSSTERHRSCRRTRGDPEWPPVRLPPSVTSRGVSHPL